MIAYISESLHLSMLDARDVVHAARCLTRRTSAVNFAMTKRDFFRQMLMSPMANPTPVKNVKRQGMTTNKACAFHHVKA